MNKTLPEKEIIINSAGGEMLRMAKEYIWFISFLVLSAPLIILISPLKEMNMYFIFIPVFILIIFCGYLYTKALKNFIIQFGRTNNMRYVPQEDSRQLAGRLFNIGTSRHMTNILYGAYLDHPTRIFHYSYTIGSGKQQHTIYFTVLEITFEKTIFPHILLRSKSMSKHSMPDFWGTVHDVSVPLEPAFKEKFQLYCTQKFEIEVFQIFTPDILTMLVKEASHLSIEFSKNKIYIYDDKIVANSREMNLLYGTAKKIMDKSAPLLNRLHDDMRAMHHYIFKDSSFNP